MLTDEMMGETPPAAPIAENQIQGFITNICFFMFNS